jgi:Tfp pilus assembly protein PilV
MQVMQINELDDERRRPERRSAPPLASEKGFGLVEALVALIILSVGLLAIAGIALSVSAQTRAGVDTTAQVIAGQQVLETMVQQGYGNVSTGDTTVRVGHRTFTVGRSITASGVRWQEVEARVESTGDRPAQTLTTRLHARRAPPTSAP